MNDKIDMSKQQFKLHQWLLAKRGLGINPSVDTIYMV